MVTTTKGGHGTGFFIDEKNILTNAHVVLNARKGSLHIKSPATGNLKFKVDVVGVGGDNSIDLAVLRLPADEQVRFKKRSGLDKIPCLSLGESSALKQSDELAILGFPENSDELKVIKAEVTGIQYQNYNATRFIINHHFIEVGPGGVVLRGNSGGPALNRNGQVVGIPTLGDWQGNQGWLMPVDIVKLFIDRIKNGRCGKVPLNPPDLGVEFLTNTAGNLVLAGAPEDIVVFELGVIVHEILPQSIAEKWGFKPGDILVGFANKQKGLSCALDFEGFRVITGKMATWPQQGAGSSNRDNIKLHLKELFFISTIGDEITLWYLRPEEGKDKIALHHITKCIDDDSANTLPHLGLYEKPEYEYWGDFVMQDFNDFNTDLFKVPKSETRDSGVLVTYVEPNSLASHRGLEISRMSSARFIPFFGGSGRGGKWFIIKSVNGTPVKNLDECKKLLRAAEQEFEVKKQSKEYRPERKNLYKERYVKIVIRTNSFNGKTTTFDAIFPVDDALECCKK